LELQIEKKVNAWSNAAIPRVFASSTVFLRGVDTSGAEFIELTKTLNISAQGRVSPLHILFGLTKYQHYRTGAVPNFILECRP